jgi:GGDEF domain-containing protein
MISILKSATEIDRLDNLLQAARECYMLTIRSLAQYAPEIDPSVLAKFQSHLGVLEQEWQSAESPDNMRSVQASVRGELRGYRDQTREQMSRLRKELEGAAAVMASFADGITSSSADCESEMKRRLDQLEAIGAIDDLQEIRGGIRIAVSEIGACVDQMARGTQLITAQFQDEIRLLHQEFQAERHALFTDIASGAWTRQKLDLKLNELLRQNDRFCVVLVAIRNLPRIKADYSTVVQEGTVKAMIGRLLSTLGTGVSIGRWSHNQFAGVLDANPAALGGIAANLAEKLNGTYSVQEDGMAHEVKLEVTTIALDRPVGSDAAAFLRELDRVSHWQLHGTPTRSFHHRS